MKLELLCYTAVCQYCYKLVLIHVWKLKLNERNVVFLIWRMQIRFTLQTFCNFNLNLHVAFVVRTILFITLILEIKLNETIVCAAVVVVLDSIADEIYTFIFRITYNAMDLYRIFWLQRKNHVLGPRKCERMQIKRKEKKIANIVLWLREKRTKEMAYITLLAISKITLFL